jgi:phosphoribosylformimino-5-aminoimidazole carboxamide ribotide isomerase
MRKAWGWEELATGMRSWTILRRSRYLIELSAVWDKEDSSRFRRATLGKAARVLVIPVIDLLNGHVVKAIGGRRQEYHPWLSPLAGHRSQLEPILDGLCEVVSHRSVYMADLDAITAQNAPEPRPPYLDALVSKTLFCLLDRGLADPTTLSEFLAAIESAVGGIHPVLSSESIGCPDELPEMVRLCRSAGVQPVLSLDLKHGRPFASSERWKQADPLEIVDCAVEAGLSSVIVLDLADVGEERGGTTHSICEAIHQRYPQLSLAAGGGICSYDDCRRYGDAGCDAVLVATALHNGRLTRNDCDRLRRTGCETRFAGP